MTLVTATVTAKFSMMMIWSCQLTIACTFQRPTTYPDLRKMRAEGSWAIDARSLGDFLDGGCDDHHDAVTENGDPFALCAVSAIRFKPATGRRKP
jgi:hypothetical protein